MNTPTPVMDNPFNETKADKPISKTVLVLMFLFFLTIIVYVVYMIIVLWPGSVCTAPWVGNCHITMDVRIIILVILSGALGAFIHVATSFTDFVGNKSFVDSWISWYLIRPFIGSALALIFYFLIRGGLVTPQVEADKSELVSGNIAVLVEQMKKDSLIKNNPAMNEQVHQIERQLGKVLTDTIEVLGVDGKIVKINAAKEKMPINIFGILAISCMAGLFSKQAIDKLREIFESLFRLAKETPRADKLNEPVAPGTAPASANQGSTVPASSSNPVVDNAGDDDVDESVTPNQ